MLLKLGKKGVSILIGYVLLVVFAIIISAIVFTWLRSYVPSESLNCPDGTSVFVKESSFDDATSELKIVLKNNGRFDLAGYFIHATNNSSQEVATLDLSPYLNSISGGKIFGNSIVFMLGSNTMNPGDQETNIFDIPSSLGLGELYSVNIIPVRYQVEDNRERFVSCSNAKAENLVGEPVAECVPEDITTTCGTWVCGERVNNCGNLVSCPPGCTGTDVCDSTGSCVPPAQCTDTCATFEYECGTWTICGVQTACGSLGGACQSGFECNATGRCATIVNGVCDPGETCAQEPTACQGQQAQCLLGNICISGSCQPISGGVDCTNYCISLPTPYTTSTCVGPPGQCGSQYGGTLQPGGDQYCPSQTNKCCCIP